MIPLIPIAISLAAKFAPMLLGKLFGTKAGETADKVIGLATKAVGGGAPENLLSMLEANSAAALQFQEEANDLTSKLYTEDTKRLEAVNKTMQFESRSLSFMQRAWRPINGLMFGISIWTDYFLAPIILSIANSTLQLTHVPMEIYLLWSAVLGVTSWGRTKEKLKQISSGTIF